MALALTDAPPAHAQQGGDHWQISAPTYTCNYSASAGAHITKTDPNDVYGGGIPPGTLTVSGTATITCTWVSAAGNPAPSVLIQESAVGAGGVYQSGQAVYTGPPPIVRYSVKDSPSNSFTLTSPQMSATVTLQLNGGGQASVTYSVSLASVFVTPNGVNAANQALTGQQVTAQLSAFPTSPPGYKISSYTWSFTGGTAPNPIKNWDGTNNLQQLFLLTSIDMSGTDTSPNHTGIAVANLPFYDQVGDTVTVKCAVNFSFPDGTTGTINPQSQPVKFLKPTAVWNAHSTDPTTGPVFNQTQMGYIEKWDATITVPSPFSGGNGCFAQIVTPTVQFQRSPLNNQPSLCYLKVPQTDINGNTSYVLPTTGLDTGFPYRIGSSTYQYYPQGYQWGVSTQGISADTPFVSFSIGASDNGGNNWYTAFASYTFTTWLMYQPSSGGTGPPIWVPLQRVDWNWTGNVVKNKATGQWNAATNGNQPVSGSTSDPGVATNQPPQWSNVNVGDTVLRP